MEEKCQSQILSHDEILSYAEPFTTRVLEENTQGGLQGMCFVMCYLLWKHLLNKGYRNCKIIKGRFKSGTPHETPHYWLILADGSIMDPTMKQFCNKTQCPIIRQFCDDKNIVYLGAKPEDFSDDNNITERATVEFSNNLKDSEEYTDDPNLNAQQMEELQSRIKIKKVWKRMFEKAYSIESTSPS